MQHLSLVPPPPAASRFVRWPVVVTVCSVAVASFVAGASASHPVAVAALPCHDIALPTRDGAPAAADVFGAVRAADAGGAPAIPPSELWPAQ